MNASDYVIYLFICLFIRVFIFKYFINTMKILITLVILRDFRNKIDFVVNKKKKILVFRELVLILFLTVDTPRMVLISGLVIESKKCSCYAKK